MKAYAIIITIAFWIQFALVMIYADKLRKKEREVLLSENLVIPVVAVADVYEEDFMVDGRAEEKVGAELFLKLCERGCVRVNRAHNVRDCTTTVTCIVIATPFDRN